MKISYSWLKELVPTRLSSRAMANALNESAFDTELTADPNVFEVKLPPNRVCDASGHLGFAKEVSRIAGKPIAYPDASFRASRARAQNHIGVKVDAKNLCRRYTAAYIENVSVGKSPAWMQKRLTECGVRPINAVVDITNYVMLEYGQPLHAFDADKLAQDKQGKAAIIVRRAHKGERITTLEDKSYELAGFELLICDAKDALAVAGIKGGRKAEIDRRTKRIIVESANFDPISVRQTSRALGIRTDASVRFENDLDPNLTEAALRRVCNLVESICSGSAAKGFVDVYPVKMKPIELIVSLEQASRLIGVQISAKTAEAAFALFCDSVKKQKSGTYVLTVNTMRRDIARAEDVVEEIARFIGYDAIPEQTVSEPVRPARIDERMEEKWLFQDIAVKLGFDEVMNYSLIEENDKQAFGIAPDSFVRVTVPVSGKYTYLRPGLLAGLLKNVRDNNRYFPSMKLFEIGRVYRKHERPDERMKTIVPEERSQLGLVLYGAKTDDKARREQFLDLKGYLEAMFKAIGISESEWRFETIIGDERWNGYEPSEFARIVVSGIQVGMIGNIAFWLYHDGYGVDMPVSFCEIEMDALYALRAKKYYDPLPRFPDALRDISVLVNPDSTASEIESIIQNAGSRFLYKAELFDVFVGSMPPSAGRKSMSFHLRFRSSERTLTEGEINKDMDLIEQALKQDEKAAARIR